MRRERKYALEKEREKAKYKYKTPLRQEAPTEPVEVQESEKVEGLLSKVSKTVERLNELSYRLNDLVRDKVVGPKLMSKWDRMSSLKRKVYATTIYSALILGSIETQVIMKGHELSNNKFKVTKSEKPDKKKRAVEYEHEDNETTHILNVIAGKESFTDEEVRKMTEAYVKKQRAALTSDPGSSNDIPEQELASLYNMMAKKQVIDNPTFYALDRNYWKSKPVIKEKLSKAFGEDYDEKLYETLWKIMEEAGNPKIRLVYERKHDRDRAHYDTAENTMYLYPEDLDGLGQFLAEASHGKQSKESPYYNAHRMMAEGLALFLKNKYLGEDPKKTYDETMYDWEGSTEHEAHREIEPALQKRINDLKKQLPEMEKKYKVQKRKKK